APCTWGPGGRTVQDGNMHCDLGIHVCDTTVRKYTHTHTHTHTHTNTLTHSQRAVGLRHSRGLGSCCSVLCCSSAVLQRHLVVITLSPHRRGRERELGTAVS